MVRLLLADNIHISSKPYKPDDKRWKYMDKLLLADNIILSQLQGLFQCDSVRVIIKFAHNNHSRSGVEMDF